MATYYIGPTGDDTTGDGSEGNPWLNIAYAVNNSSITDTIIVKTGTLVQTLGSNGVNWLNRTIRSESGDPRLSILDLSSVTIERIIIDPSGSVSGLTFKGNVNNDLNRYFFLVEGTISDCIFDSCVAGGDLGSDGSRGSIIAQSSGTVERCIFYNTRRRLASNGGCIMGMRDPLVPTTLTVKNCVFVDDGAVIAGVSSLTSIIALAATSGVRTMTVNVNNSIASLSSGSLTNGYSLITISLGGSGSAVNVNTTNSCIHNLDYTDGETGVITDDPLLVDPDNGFFEISANSPARGLGSL